MIKKTGSKLKMMMGYFIEISLFILAGYMFAQQFLIVGFFILIMGIIISFIVGFYIKELSIEEYKLNNRRLN